MAGAGKGTRLGTGRWLRERVTAGHRNTFLVLLVPLGAVVWPLVLWYQMVGAWGTNPYQWAASGFLLFQLLVSLRHLIGWIAPSTSSCFRELVPGQKFTSA